jgi:hypothetical protein
MLAANRIAFKERAADCHALAAGMQTIILRKGGIHEGCAGFRVAHSEFWLFPTYLHEAATALIDEAQPLLERAAADRAGAGLIRLAQYAASAKSSKSPTKRDLRGWPLDIADAPRFAGCRSWVELVEELPTGGLRPALDDEEFSRRRAAAVEALRGGDG